MNRYIAKRVLSAVPTLLGLSIVVFLLVRLVPGTVVEVMLGSEVEVTEEMLLRLRSFFGLDQPVYVQYAGWIGRALQGDFGTSWRTGKPVAELLLMRLAVTLQLTGGALVVALSLGIPLGIVSALRENTNLDHIVRILGLISLCMPIFWQAAMIILMLSRWFRWAPPVGYVDPVTDPLTNFRVMILPTIVLGTTVSASVMRMTRSCVLDVIRQNYIRTARAKGLREWAIVWTHVLKNALIPVVTVVGLEVGRLLGGSVVTEEVFTLPGVGRLVLWAVYQRDYPVVQGTVLFIGTAFVTINLLVDLIYGSLDPRVCYD